MRLRRAIILASGALITASCTLLGSREVAQCSSNGDCIDPARPVCVGRLCVASTAPALDSEVDSGSDSGVDAPTSCSQAAPCATDRPRVCVEGTCKLLVDITAGHGCHYLYRGGTEYLAPGVRFIGVYGNFGSNATDQPSGEAISLAVDDLNPALGVVAILCRKEDRSPVEALQHLQSLAVPVVIGQFEEKDFVDLSNAGIIGPNMNIAVVSTLAVQGQAAANPGVWFAIDEVPRLAEHFQVQFDRAEAQRFRIPDSGVEKTKVAMVVGPDVESSALADELESGKLLVNAKTQSAQPEEWKIYGIPASTAAEVFAHQPHVIVAIGGDEVAPFVTAFENMLNTNSVAQANRPTYVFGPRTKFAVNLLGLGNGFGARLFGVDFSGDDAKNRLLVSRSGGAISVHVGSFDLLYDTFHAVALASVVDGTNPSAVTAADIIRGLEVFRAGSSSSTEIVAGVNVTSALQTMRTPNAKIQFVGSTGAWRFDDAGLRIRRMGHSHYCVDSQLPTRYNYYVDPASDAGCLR